MYLRLRRQKKAKPHQNNSFSPFDLIFLCKSGFILIKG